MDSMLLGKAVKNWSDKLGSDNVLVDSSILDRYARSTFPVGTRPSAIVRPSSTAEVQAVVRTAAEFGIPIYPISAGKNWGLGDACAVSDGQVIVDLARMNRIHRVDTTLAYAVVEPGVTQGQVYQHLLDNQLPLWLDATGAGPDSSLIGNLMERGYGHTPVGDRFHCSAGFEVVLADGSLIDTGFGHYGSSKVTELLKVGLGPAIDGIFTQSNLGIVTRAGIWLMPKPPAFEAYAFKVDSHELAGEIIERLRPLRMYGVLNSTVHVANELRVLSSRMSYPWKQTNNTVPLPATVRESLRKKAGLGCWNVLGAFYGTKETVGASRKALKKALRGLARPNFINDHRLAWAEAACRAAPFGLGWLKELLNSVKPAYELLQGNPSGEHLRASAWRCRDAPTSSNDPLDNNHGLMWISPVLPMTGDSVNQYLSLVEPIIGRYQFDPMMTFVMMNSRAMCCPTTVYYDKNDPADCSRALACYDELFDAVMKVGYIPYRAGIHSMAKLGQGSTGYWDVVRKLKNALDPQGILAPGRYLPPEE